MEKPHSPTFETGRRIGWMLAAGKHTAFTLPRLRKEVAGYAKQASDYLTAEHPDATHMEKDAMRHAFTSAKMAQSHGMEYATYLGHCNEAIRDVTLTNDPYNRGMDLHNNLAGIEYRLLNPALDDKALLEGLWQKAKDGALVTSLSDPRVLEQRYTDSTYPGGQYFERLKQTMDGIKELNPFRCKVDFPLHEIQDASHQQKIAPDRPREK